jgi:hypothetical protein
MGASGYIKMHERIFFVTEAFFLRLNASPPYRMHVSPHLKQYCALPNVAFVAGSYQTSIHLDSIPICCWLQFSNSHIEKQAVFQMKNQMAATVRPLTRALAACRAQCGNFPYIDVFHAQPRITFNIVCYQYLDKHAAAAHRA